MNAKKCDRCGGFYLGNKPKNDWEDTPAILSIRNKRNVEIKRFDLCDDCVAGLYDWLKDGGWDDE